ncbi:M23 family metallopeptidase [Gracilimonas sp.]|uniref:M23 family metallopeptidase n=1 Tax=Gracilimonas sp. TaxID=1974203 RepID=UPI002871963F|nr:M23 family metallopeptidase [Gracilimonas sp.]
MSASPFSEAQQYLWPTDSGQYLSSTFGETRSAHFHAGLDIKTWGQEGYKVFASRDGILHRLLITERGYGKAIYLKHPDNTYTVYAHLQRFNDTFQHLADSIRLSDYSFEMDVEFDSLAIPVKQGDVIGYTGSSGIGPPHLHFEVRNSNQNAVNALSTNLEVKDTIPPVFSSLIVEPLTKKSRIEGNPYSRAIRPNKVNGVFDFGTIRITGESGLAVNVYDQSNEVYNAYAVYSLALVHESDTLFYQELNSLSFSDSGEMFLDRIAPFGSTNRGHQRLYSKDGHNNPFYLIEKPAAQILPAESAKTYTIIATDYFGNRSNATIQIEKDGFDNSSSPKKLLPIYNWYWHEDWASPDLQSTIDLTSRKIGLPWKTNQQVIYRDSLLPINIARLFPSQNQTLLSSDNSVLIRFNEDTFFDTLSIGFTHKIVDGQYQISIQPEMAALKKNFQLQYYMGHAFKPGNKYRLFRKNNSKSGLSYVDSELQGRTVYAYPDEFGEFVIISDNTPPEISNFKIYRTDYGKWLASVDLKDELTGIDSSSAKFTINGVHGIAEYDYEENLLIYYLPNFEPKQTNQVFISVKDKAGNIASFNTEEIRTGF